MVKTKGVVVVTGSSSGIGKATATAFKQVGYTVYATARRSDSVDALQREGFCALQLDVTNDASMVAVLEQITAEHSAVDVLVNNAGYSLPGPVEELAMEDLRRVFETNVFGLVRMSQLVLPGMRLQGNGRIINVGSVGGTFTTPGSAAYHATKWAVESFSDGLRAEVKGFGVDVVLIQPGGVGTNFVNAANVQMPDVADSPYATFKANIVKTTERMFASNTGRWGILTPERVATVIVNAAQATTPRTRYKVGTTARVLPVLHWILPDRTFDRLWMSQFPMR